MKVSRKIFFFTFLLPRTFFNSCYRFKGTLPRMDVPNIRVADADGCLVPLSLAELKDPVEFSNACRAFYKARVEATAKMKERVRYGGVGTSSCNRSSNSNSSKISNSNNNSDGNSNADGAIGGQDSELADPLDADLNSSVTNCVNNGENARARRRSNRDKSAMDSAMEILRREMVGFVFKL